MENMEQKFTEVKVEPASAEVEVVEKPTSGRYSWEGQAPVGANYCSTMNIGQMVKFAAVSGVITAAIELGTGLLVTGFTVGGKALWNWGKTKHQKNKEKRQAKKEAKKQAADQVDIVNDEPDENVIPNE